MRGSSTRIQDEKKDVRNMISTQVTSYFFLLGKAVLGNLSTARSFISLRSAVAQNFMSTHPTVIEICQCRTERWTDTQTQPSPELLAWRRTNLTWIPISCSAPPPMSPCHPLLSPLLPSVGSLGVPSICREEEIFVNDRQALISTQQTNNTTGKKKKQITSSNDNILN